MISHQPFLQILTRVGGRIFGNLLGRACGKQCAAALAADTVEVEKKAPKPGEAPKIIDIKPMINGVTIAYDKKTGKIILDATLSAESQRFLNPEYLIKALRQKVGILSNPDLTKEHYTILRTTALRSNLTPFA